MAAGAWAGALAPGRLPVHPVKGQLLELHTRERGGDPLDRHRAHARAATSSAAATAAWSSARTDGGAGLRHDRHGRRRLPPARGAPGRCCPTCGSSSWRACRAGLRPGTPDNRAADRARARSTGSSGPPGITATASCSPRSPARRWPTCWPAGAAGRGRRAGRRALRDGGGGRMTSVLITASRATCRTARPWPRPCASRRAEPAGRGVAVAVDGEVVPRGQWDSTAAGRGPARRGRSRRCRAAEAGGSPTASSARA